MTWTRFWDTNSGGGPKEGFTLCFIEASRKEAELIFYNRFGHNPNRVSCTCCGEDYSIWEYKTLEKATEYHRNDNKISLENFVKKDYVYVIYASDILDEERQGYLPDEGYIWH